MTANVNNAFVLDDETCAIPLTKGLYALIDRCDYEKISKHKWYAHRRKNTWYASRSVCVNGKKLTISMHQEIIGTKEGFETDHKNGYGLDNRSKNLRFCTHAENIRNQRRQTEGKTSKYKGVSFSKHAKKWTARITLEGKLIFLGYFDTEIEAARVYDKAAIQNFGEFASVNLASPEGLDAK